jgi:hypothetical protein
VGLTDPTGLAPWTWTTRWYHYYSEQFLNSRPVHEVAEAIIGGIKASIGIAASTFLVGAPAAYIAGRFLTWKWNEIKQGGIVAQLQTRYLWPGVRIWVDGRIPWQRNLPNPFYDWLRKRGWVS